MVGFGSSDETMSTFAKWEWGDYEKVDRASITTTELWMLREKIESDNAKLKQINSSTWKATLTGGEEYFIATMLGEIYFIRKIASTKNFGSSEQFTFEH